MSSKRVENSSSINNNNNNNNIDEAKLKDFMGKIVNDLGATWSTVLVIIGDKLGLYKAMADSKPVTPAELASRTGTTERCVREWLANQAAGGYISYDPNTAKYTLPTEQAMAQLPVSIWGYSDTELRTFPHGAPAKKGTLSDAPFLFTWPEENVNGIKKWNKKYAVNVFVFQYDGKFHTGYSGAPVCYTGNNNVIGVFTAKDNDYGWVIPIQTILEKFEKQIDKPAQTVDTASIINEGNKHFDIGELNKAIECYEKVIYDPNHAIVWYNKGNALAKKLRKHNEAIECYDKALELNPNDSSAWNNKGNALYRLGKYNEAIECYDKAIELDPNNAYGWYNRACSKAKKGEIKSALTNLEKAIEIGNQQFIECAKKDNNFESIRDDERFKVILRET